MGASKRDFLQEEFNIGTGRRMRQAELTIKLAEAHLILLNLSDMLPEDYKRISELLNTSDLYKDTVRQIAQGDGRI
jgi:hypothetical protein